MAEIADQGFKAFLALKSRRCLIGHAAGRRDKVILGLFVGVWGQPLTSALM